MVWSWFQNSFYHVGCHIFLHYRWVEVSTLSYHIEMYGDLHNRWVKVITLSYHVEMYKDLHNGWVDHRSWDDAPYNSLHVYGHPMVLVLPSYVPAWWQPTDPVIFSIHTTFQITSTFWHHVLETTHRVYADFKLAMMFPCSSVPSYHGQPQLLLWLLCDYIWCHQYVVCNSNNTTSQCLAIAHTDSNAPMSIENWHFYGHMELNSELYGSGSCTPQCTSPIRLTHK